MIKSEKTIIPESNGYSLIEVVISVQIFLMILTFIYTIYHYQNRFFHKWESNNALLSKEIVLNRALNHIQKNVYTIEYIDDHSLSYTDKDKKKHILLNENQALMFDGKKLPLMSNLVEMEIVALFVNRSDKNSVVKISEIDLNGDRMLNDHELEGIKGIKINLKYIMKHQNITDTFILR